MARFISLDAVTWAAEHLHNSCKSLFADFLILKREGMRVEDPVIITSVSTATSAQRLLGIHQTPPDAARYYFNPFANVRPWRHDEYPRSGTYTTIERSRPLHKLMDVARAGGGIKIALRPDYLDHAQATFRIKSARPVGIAPLAFSAWCARYDELPDDITEAGLVKRIFAEYGVTDAEALLLFSGDASPPTIFSDHPLDAIELARRLSAIWDTAEEDTISNDDEVEAPDTGLPTDLVEFLRGPLLLPESLLRQLVTLVRAGKHIIMTGPPGTGKTTLAARLAEASEKGALQYDLPSSTGCIFTTATADWSTFDTMGGYVPDSESRGLVFHEGIFLEAIRQNRWVVIDELNRADVDKAFGQFFTLLSGHNVRTPFRDGGEPVQMRVDPNQTKSGKTPETATYVLGTDWRLLATMNSFDRNSLFQLSAAFVRRFAIVHVGIPPADELKGWIAQRDLTSDELSKLSALIDIVTSARPLGPAIWSDFADYLTISRTDAGAAGQAAILEALSAFVLPQMDGLDPERLESFRSSLLNLFPEPSDATELKRVLDDVF